MEEQMSDDSTAKTTMTIDATHVAANLSEFLKTVPGSEMDVVSGYLSTAVVLFTVVTNCIVCVVLLKPHMRCSPTNVILVALSVTTTMTITATTVTTTTVTATTVMATTMTRTTVTATTVTEATMTTATVTATTFDGGHRDSDPMTATTVTAVTTTMTGVWPLPCNVYFYVLGGYRDWVPAVWCFAYDCLTDYLPTIFHTIRSIHLIVSIELRLVADRYRQSAVASRR